RGRLVGYQGTKPFWKGDGVRRKPEGSSPNAVSKILLRGIGNVECVLVGRRYYLGPGSFCRSGNVSALAASIVVERRVAGFRIGMADRADDTAFAGVGVAELRIERGKGDSGSVV